MQGNLHERPRHRGGGHHLPRRTVEVFVQREQSVGLQFPERATQLLLNSIDRVIKIAAIHSQPARAQLPVGPQQEMKAK